MLPHNLRKTFMGIKQKTKKAKKCHFFKSTNTKFSILEQFLKIKACKSEKNDAKGTDVGWVSLYDCQTV